MIQKYINSLYGKTYKILPIYEEKNEDVKIYAKSLAIEMLGATSTFPSLKMEKYYIELINIINFFANNDCDHFTCRKQIFRCRDLLNKLSFDMPEDSDEEV